ncbi:MAG: gliding motility protein GldM [Chitinophagaceae bacterium]|nr:MAG: gliding motility protein GldM [Chitinophagaceae bacterium]
MSKVKVSPRQRFISLMYLVLLAMLALSIPDTVLNAFSNINENLVEGIQKTQKETTDHLSYFEVNRLKNDTARNMAAFRKANAARQITNELDLYIDSLKKAFVEAAGGFKPNTNELNSPENTSVTYQFFQKDKRANALRAKLEATQVRLKALFPENERNDLSLKPELKDGTSSDGKKLTWEEHNFGPETPATAAFTILTMFSSDVANTENYIVKKLLGRLDEAIVNLDRYMAVAAAPSSYILAGQPYKASVYLTSYDSKQTPSISVNNRRLNVMDGVGDYQVVTSTPGVYSWRGSITVKQTDGTFKNYLTPPQTYQVARPAATIAASRMNVVYAGIENPIEISSAGIASEQLSVRVNGAGSLRKTATGYEYEVGADAIGQKVVFQVSANVNGRAISIGDQEFRIKRIKDPVAKVAGKSSGSISAVALRNQGFLYATLDDFEFDVKFSIVRFNFIRLGSGREFVSARNTGGDFNQEVRTLLGTLSPGDRVIFDNIIAKGPEGRERLLNSIILNVN